jgi:alginate O-acetyltransferase complex protein AlgI
LLFTEPLFLFLFLPVLLALYFLRRVHSTYANWLLLVASVIFYVKGGGAFTWLMLASIAFNYWMAIAVDRARATGRERHVLTAAIAVNLVTLGIFKYANFFADNLNAVLGALGASSLNVPHVLLPIGISFYTFHAISYVVDVYRRDASAQKSPVHAALYLLLFPQLIAGPIIRYRHIAGQLARREVSLDDVAMGVRRFVIGLGKKVLVANTVAEVADKIFGMPHAQLTPAHAWLGVVCYTIQIYFDFSGYSDMAIGLGRMFGFHFPENFRWPYIASTVQDFWHRWHMSLSSWFRDYVYVPLGGNRIAPARTYVNLVTVFFLCGLWHGASWNFVLWGLFHGTFLVLERLRLASLLQRIWRPLRHAYTLLVVMVGWVLFRAETLPDAAAFLSAMAGRAASAPTPFAVTWYLTPALWLTLAAGAVGSLPIGPSLTRLAERVTGMFGSPEAAGMGTPGLSAPTARELGAFLQGRPAFNTAGVAFLGLVLIASIVQIAARTYNPFIYFRF